MCFCAVNFCVSYFALRFAFLCLDVWGLITFQSKVFELVLFMKQITCNAIQNLKSNFLHLLGEHSGHLGEDPYYFSLMLIDWKSVFFSPMKTYRSCALFCSLPACLCLASIIIQYFSILRPRKVFKVYMR